MNFYKTKSDILQYNNYGEVKKQSFLIFNKYKTKTKRKPYIKAAYFDKEKVFFNYFWPHLFQKKPKERVNRLKYFEPAIELIEKTRNKPTIKINPNNQKEILYRFYGLTYSNRKFCVQIKQDIKNSKKYFISCFPCK